MVQADDLETLAPYLWLMSTRSSSNISPLHHQKVKGRQIILTENPRFHLIWYYEKIFVKPIPRYLLAHAFWRRYLLNPSSSLGEQREMVLRAAIGLLRTYSFLCKYESDFRIALELRLVPEGTSWQQMCAFIDGFRYFGDAAVSQRYHYGEVRLTRLNFWTTIILHRRYEMFEAQFGHYIAAWYGPWIVVFAVVSVALNAMQVVLSTYGLTNELWPMFVRTSQYFGTIAMGLVALAMTLVILAIIVRILQEIVFTIRKMLTS